MRNYIKGLVLFSGITMLSLYGMEQVPRLFKLGEKVEVHFTTIQGQKKTAHFRKLLGYKDIYKLSPTFETDLLGISADSVHDFIVRIDSGSHAKLVGIATFWGLSEAGHMEAPTPKYIEQAYEHGFDVSEFKGIK